MSETNSVPTEESAQPRLDVATLRAWYELAQQIYRDQLNDYDTVIDEIDEEVLKSIAESSFKAARIFMEKWNTAQKDPTKKSEKKSEKKA